MAQLMIFDLQRFALHDGPGIRTTVFFKGCPLNCLWCHNPESKNRNPQLGFLEKNCVSCVECMDVCPENVHSFAPNGSHQIDYSRCRACGACAERCMHKALKVYGYTVTPEEVLKTVIRDRDFYRTSGGGLTVSGGEPMMQFAGLKELLKQAKDLGLHVCLDTCGFAPTDHYLEIAPLVDIFLFDYKITDPDAHRRYTGVDNGLILKNLDTLCGNGSHIYLRCPIIPGINDNDDHYRAIAGLSRTYPSIDEVNLMTYHDFAKGKAAQLGAAYPLEHVKTIDAENKKEIYRQVEALGCLRLKMS